MPARRRRRADVGRQQPHVVRAAMISCTDARIAASIAAGLVLFVQAHATDAGGSGPGGIAYLQGLAGIEKVDVATGARLSPALDLRQQHSIAVSANGRKVFSVSPHKPGVNFGPGELTIIDAPTMTIEARVTVGESPLAVAGSPDGRRAYVTSNLDGTLSAVDIQARKVAFTYPVRSPDGVEVSADGGTVYVNVLEGVAALDSRTGAGHVHELPRIVDEYPGALVVSKDGSRLYVATFVANELLTGFVTAIALPQYAVVGRIEVGRWPRGMALAADGGKLYVANGADGTVSVIDAAPLQLAKTIPVGVDPLGVASSFDGATVLVTNSGSANVTFIDTGTDTLVRTIDAAGVTSCGRFIGVAPGIIDAVVEFYHAALDHYFVTQDAAEIAVLEEGTHPGWNRTGHVFSAFKVGQFPAITSPVCRYLGLPSAGLNSHFYSADPAECARVRRDFPLAWQLEADEVYRVSLPDADSGDCGGTRTPVFRLWNNRPDSNHRYVVDPVVRQAMLAKGYVAEGYGPNAVALCAP